MPKDSKNRSLASLLPSSLRDATSLKREAAKLLIRNDKSLILIRFFEGSLSRELSAQLTEGVRPSSSDLKV